ncbi:hypothetical protein IQ241_15025 [Romeria aff. gracilis LEGE 07310]|uniref:UPF0367 protein IQ241_15025 n=1 Tax=Vasconcelosia minhoensis LEGE 07310 TaxID=915328 RepID=A0A8J7DME5_9CYAN|nr:hypothetical protein [Romeria gracilis]MBE9078591.1 hypothetical protein [Romeria aff. gracilis LEGE 07310]
MYILELTLKHTALPLSIQKQTAEAAEAAYGEISKALNSGSPVMVELTCDKQPDKKLAVLVSELAAVQVYEKSGSTTASGKAPGFFALAAE